MRTLLLALFITLLPVTADDGVRVSVLGYHLFSSDQPATAMRIPTAKFKEQMLTLKKSGLPIISLPQFLAWRRGEDTLPSQSFMITMDDGWESVYTEAWPVLREMKIPFTVYLYKNYVGKERGGRALSLEMIKEMMDSGLCSIGSHSVTHPRPSVVKSSARKGANEHDLFLRRELGESKRFLEDLLKIPVTTYAYPGGFHTPEMYSLADEFGYDHLFTVLPGKVRQDSVAHTLPRYIVLGNHDGAFEASLIFRNSSRVSSDSPVAETELPVAPGAGHLISERLPTIRVDFSSVDNLDLDSVEMRVGGFGKVPTVYNPNNKVISWTVTRPLRQPVCEVSVSWNQQRPMRWNFRIDHEAHYQPK